MQIKVSKDQVVVLRCPFSNEYGQVCIVAVSHDFPTNYPIFNCDYQLFEAPVCGSICASVPTFCRQLAHPFVNFFSLI